GGAGGGRPAMWEGGRGVGRRPRRRGGPGVAVVCDNGGAPSLEPNNSTGPGADLAGSPTNPAAGPATGVWGTVRDQVATVVKAMGTFGKGKNGQPTPMAYGAFVAHTFLPNLLRFTPGTPAFWDPWNGIKNGKSLSQ